MVGVAGWAYKDWAGIVYPPSLRSGHRLEYLAQFFDLVEINTSFYGHIKPAVARDWCERVQAVNPRFVFTAKLNRAFTHSPQAVIEPTSADTISPSKADERDVKAGLDAIANRGLLGAVLAQFPISFKCTDANRAYINRLVHVFRDYPVVVEVRHASWNNAEVLSWLTDLGAGLCNVDQPLLGRAIPPASHATSGVGYVRLHGRNYEQWFSDSADVTDRYDYLYSKPELSEWRDRIEALAVKVEETYVIANNHNFGKAAITALELTYLITGMKVSVPPTLSYRYPQLEEIAATS